MDSEGFSAGGGCCVSHLESTIDGTHLPCDRVQTMHKDRPLWVRYDLPFVKTKLKQASLRDRPATLWRYREMLPLPFNSAPVTFGEGMSPLLPVPRLAKELGLDRLWVKDESQLPTGSFKSRGLAMAVSMAHHFGIKRLAIPTAGNAGGAMAAYAARAGIEAYVFMPQDTPIANQTECQLAGAKVFLVEGLITDCGAIVKAGKEPMAWFDCSTLKEPYRLEGKKTMGLELAEQLDWRLPDVIIYPTGGGTGLIGMWKAFAEMRELGWLKSDKMPRMIAVQSDGCAPIVRAFEKGERFAEPFENAHTIASGLRVPAAVGDFMILDAIRESIGWAVAVPEAKIARAMQDTITAEGISVCPEAAACVLALKELVRDGRITPADSVVVFNTGTAGKYTESVKLDLPLIKDSRNVDFDRLAS